MTSQPGYQTIAINILSNVSGRKGNETIKFGQLIEYKKRKINFKNHEENEARRLVPDFFLFFRKDLYKIKKVLSRFIVSLNLLLEILDNMCFAIIC